MAGPGGVALQALSKEPEWIRSELIPKAPISKELIPKASVPRKSIPRELIPKASIPRDQILKAPIPKKPLPKASIPRELIPREPIPRELIPKASIPRELIPRKPIPRELIPKAFSTLGSGRAAHAASSSPSTCPPCPDTHNSHFPPPHSHPLIPPGRFVVQQRLSRCLDGHRLVPTAPIPALGAMPVPSVPARHRVGSRVGARPGWGPRTPQTCTSPHLCLRELRECPDLYE